MDDALLVRARRIRFLSCDVDGVLTDGRIYVDDHGHEFKAFSALDGVGLRRAVALEDPAFHRRCWAEHAAMLAAILTGDADAAAAIAAHHCEVAGREVWERLASTAARAAA